MIDRQRKVDVTKMSPQEVDVMGIQVGDKVRLICDEAALKINAILGIYGASAKIAIQIEALPDSMAKSMGVKQKSQKTPRKANLKKERTS